MKVTQIEDFDESFGLLDYQWNQRDPKNKLGVMDPFVNIPKRLIHEKGVLITDNRGRPYIADISELTGKKQPIVKVTYQRYQDFIDNTGAKYEAPNKDMDEEIIFLKFQKFTEWDVDLHLILGGEKIKHAEYVKVDGPSPVATFNEMGPVKYNPYSGLTVSLPRGYQSWWSSEDGSHNYEKIIALHLEQVYGSLTFLKNSASGGDIGFYADLKGQQHQHYTWDHRPGERPRLSPVYNPEEMYSTSGRNCPYTLEIVSDNVWG